MTEEELALLPEVKKISEGLSDEHPMEARKAWDDMEAFIKRHGVDIWNRILDFIQLEPTP